MAIHGKSRDKVIEGLRSRTPFKNSTGSLYGVEGAVSHTGWADPDLARQYRDDRPTYTVMSYNTPIGWVTRSGLVRVPNVKYSATTMQHQYTVRAYLAD